VDNRLPVGQNTTTYSYDPASNLATVTYPNGLESQFTYDTLNRITAMNAAKASYSYTLSPTGNRTGAVESSGRAVNWSYDGIYRLTNETISLDPHSVNGSVGYGLDPVGNRQSQTSSIPGIGTGTFTYDADDRLNSETYDANGNTLTSDGKTFAYDFENRLKSMNNGAVTIQYDADGNRVAKTVAGVTTRYLVDDLNPTGLAQVVEEVTGTTTSRFYTYGLQRISENQQISNAWTPSFYGYDGGGTVRLLTDATGTVTDTYDYDAWGNAVNTTGSTPNVYLYRGEQFDPDLGLYYLRARYFNPASGRFLSRDPEAGRSQSPITLHKYLYGNGDPVGNGDPSGMDTMPMPWPVPQPAPAPQTKNPGRSMSEYVMLALAFGLNAAIDVEIYRSGQDIKCAWQATDSDLEAAEMIAVLSAFEWVTPNRPPGGIGEKGPPLPPNMPPPDDPGPSGESCGKCNCAIKCTVRLQGGTGKGGYGGEEYRWAFGRGDDKESCRKNAQKNFNDSNTSGDGRTAGHCPGPGLFNKMIFGKYCR
jgi:RHS repeat-associated protein